MNGYEDAEEWLDPNLWAQAVREEHRAMRLESRAELIKAITTANRTAMRLPHILGGGDYRTPWDAAHRYIDHLLDDLIGR